MAVTPRCACLKIEGTIYKALFGPHLKDLNNLRLEYLSNMPLFGNWDRSNLLALLPHISLVTKSHDEYVYKAGEIDKYIYVVMAGELEIIATYVDNTEEKESNLSEYIIDKYTKHRPIVKELPIMKLAVGNYFGDEEGFEQKVKQFSVKVKSNNTKIFVLAKDVRREKKLHKKF